MSTTPSDHPLNREGFWNSADEPLLPAPQGSHFAWTGLSVFLEQLHLREAMLTPNLYRGSSRCRLCNKLNGNGEYELDGWVWPSGFRHYVEDHFVRPSLAFQEFILGRHLKGRSWEEKMEAFSANIVNEILEDEDNQWRAEVDDLLKKGTQ